MDAAAERRPRIGNGWGDVKEERRVKAEAERAQPTGRRVGPPPARRRTPPSRRLPLKGGVITDAPYEASATPRQVIPPNSPQRPFKHSSITPPLRGSRTSPSRMAKDCAEGERTRRAKGEILWAVAGSHRPSYGRRLMRRGGRRLSSGKGEGRGQVEAGVGAEKLRTSLVRTGRLLLLRIFRR